MSVAIIINNYLHDMATGVLVAAAVIMYAMMRKLRTADGDRLAALRMAYPALTRLATFALVWIAVGGVPRVIFFREYEWDPAVAKGLVSALAVKHVLMFSAVAAGVWLWSRARAAIGIDDRQAEE